MANAAANQIQRARRAVGMLVKGCSILDAVFEAGHYGQAHLTRLMKQLIRTTPAQIRRTLSRLSFSTEV